MSNNWHNPFYNILLNKIGHRNVKHSDITVVGNMDMREFQFSNNGTLWIFCSTENMRGKNDNFYNQHGKIKYQLILKDGYPNVFYVNNKEYSVNKDNINFILKKFPYLKNYFEKNSHILEKLKKINSTDSKNKPSSFELFFLYLLGIFRKKA